MPNELQDILGRSAAPKQTLMELLKSAWDNPPQGASLIGILKGAYQGAKLPGDVYQGNVQAGSPEYYNRANDLAGLVTGGSYAMPAVKGGAGMGIRAYHGSPYDFDKFSLKNVGTGEGAQAYGHGLYFAEAEPVAKQYRNQLAGMDVFLNDKRVGTGGQLGNDYNAIAAYQLALGETPESIRKMVKGWGNYQTEAQKKHLVDAFDQLVKEGATAELKPAGRMYEVNINAKPEQFLDWDKPLSAQPHLLPNLHAAGMTPKSLDTSPLAKYGDWGEAQAKYINDVGGKTGSTVYMDAGLRAGGYGRDYGKAATPILREAGIPGIKYLDQGSRDLVGATITQTKKGDWEVSRKADGSSAYFDTRAEAERFAQGTNNYVLFDDSIIDILRKYGIAGAASLPAAASYGEVQRSTQ